jgi:hypothetical protein
MQPPATFPVVPFMTRTIACFALIGIAAPVLAQPSAPAALPKVLLIGDWIRLGYAPLVAKKLAGTSEVISVPAPIGDTTVVLKHLDEWLAGKPAVVHFYSGLHDVKVAKTAKTHQVPVETYKWNLATVVERIRKVTPYVVFANTTPIRDDRDQHGHHGAVVARGRGRPGRAVGVACLTRH